MNCIHCKLLKLAFIIKRSLHVQCHLWWWTHDDINICLNIFGITDSLCRESNARQGFTSPRASGVDHWFLSIFCYCLCWTDQAVERTYGWFETPCHSCAVTVMRQGKDATRQDVARGTLGAVSILRCCLTNIGIPMLKIRRSPDRLIVNKGIPMLGKDGLYIETGSWFYAVITWKGSLRINPLPAIIRLQNADLACKNEQSDVLIQRKV